MPKPMDYNSQAILVLAPDLLEDANDLQRKREAAGDTKNAFNHQIAKSRVFQNPQITTLPIEYRQNSSRLYILGHGNKSSTLIKSAQEGGISWTPEQLYDMLESWFAPPGFLPSRVKRISLLMCYGGGNRGTAPVAGSSSNQSAFIVKPENSFAYKFARIAGSLTADVTARTDVGQGGRKTSEGKFLTAYQMVGEVPRHKGEGDKFVFTTVAGSAPTRPGEPTYVAARKF